MIAMSLGMIEDGRQSMRRKIYLDDEPSAL